MTAETLFNAVLEKASGREPLKPQSLADKLAMVDWLAFEEALTRDGYAVIPALLTCEQCESVTGYFPEDQRFRSRIVMERYAFGRGEYKYFRDPLPDLISELRRDLYPRLSPIANRWHAVMRIAERFPATHAEFSEICRRAGQTRPTPLLLRYGANDYCCLHQDLYGDHVFPFQAVFLLNEPGRDFDGGELLLTETHPTKPGRAQVVPLRQGDAAIFAVNHRPVRSARGFHRLSLRHGVSRLHRGQRHTLGIIFHDAR